MSKTTVTSIAREIPTEAAAWVYLEEMRWPNGARCPKCSGQDVYLIVPDNGMSRRTSSGSMSERRTWNCRPCRKQFSATTGTAMHGTRIAIRTWILVMFEMAASKNGVAALEIQRKYGLTSRAAWHLLHRIRWAMEGNAGPMFTGDVAADETWIGGDPKNWHASEGRPKFRGNKTNKVTVAAVIESKTRRTRARAVPNVTGRTLRKFIAANVDMPLTTLHTDSAPAYIAIGEQMAGHFAVNHNEGVYANDKTKGTNQVEAFFSQLKRSLDGTHHHVSPEHVNRYLGEFSWRYSTCKLTDAERFGLLVDQLDRGQLTYDALTA
jgi:transposase-like protein